MQVISSGAELPAALRGAVAALGNFDGFHSGHQAVVGAAACLAAGRTAPLAVMTFDPHPAQLFRPGHPPFALASRDQKLAQLAAFGVDLAIVIPFTRDFANCSAADFVGTLLAQELQLAAVVSGYDFTFGHNRSGTTEMLPGLAEQFGMTAQVVGPVVTSGSAGQPISSSLIRQKLAQGAPRDASRLMGRWWCLQGIVLHVDKRGRLIGFPTANIALGAYLQPRAGVYAVRVHGAAARTLEGVANIGTRPTVNGTDTRLEVHLFDFSGDLYGKQLGVDIVEFIRPEQKFDGLDMLQAQIAVDGATAQKILRQPAYGAARMKSKTRQDFVGLAQTTRPAA